MIEIFSDLYDIAKRLKQIDANYRVFYNNKKQKFELHRDSGGKVSYQLTFPFDTLDARAIEHCLKTRKQRAMQLLQEIEKENILLEKQRIYQAKKQVQTKVENYLRKKQFV